MNGPMPGAPFDGDWRAAFKGEYITAAELGNKAATIRIRACRIIALESTKPGQDEDSANKKMKDRLVVFFDGSDRGWVVPRTNAICIAAMFGNDTHGWIGKRVTIHGELVQVGPKKDLGIRVVGSPDIAEQIRVEIKLPRRKAVWRTLVNTAKAAPPPVEDPVEEEDSAAE